MEEFEILNKEDDEIMVAVIILDILAESNTYNVEEIKGIKGFLTHLPTRILIDIAKERDIEIRGK